MCHQRRTEALKVEMASSISFAQQRQNYLRQLSQACPESLPELHTYLSSYTQLIAPPYKKTRDPLAMKELSSKCPSCSRPYTVDAFRYRGKMKVNRRLHRLLSIYRRYKRLPTAQTYKRRLFDQFANRSRSKLFVKCSHCRERRSFDGATRKDLPKETMKIVPKTKPVVVVHPTKLKQTLEKASCRFLKKESSLRAFLEGL